MESSKQVGITEVVVRDGIQSLLATRVPLRDLVSILPALDKVGYWSLETWGGATYDSCIRYLNEDPWERLRTFNSLLKNLYLVLLPIFLSLNVTYFLPELSLSEICVACKEEVLAPVSIFALIMLLSKSKSSTLSLQPIVAFTTNMA